MKRNLDYFVVLFVCLLIFSVLYVIYDNSNEQSYSSSHNVIALRGSSRSVSMRGRSVQNSAFSGGMMGGEYQYISSGRTQSHVSAPTHSYDHFRGLSTPVASSKSLLSSQVMHGSTTSSNVNLGGAGVFNFAQRSASAPIAQPNISMPVYAQSLKISSSLSQVRTNSSGDVEVARRSLVSSASRASSFSSSNAYSSYQPSVYGQGITLSRDGALAYGTAYGTAYGHTRANAPQRAPGNVGGTWENWLDDSWSDEDGYGVLDNGVYWFDDEEARAAYEAQFGEGSSWNKTMGNSVGYDQFLYWLRNNTDGKYRMPLGDIVPLILMALSYLVMMFVRRR